MHKKNRPVLGRAVINARENLPSAKRKKHKLMRKNDEDLNRVLAADADADGGKNLFSVTEQNSLDEFLAKAQLAGTEFTAERQQFSVVDAAAGQNKLVGVVSPQDEAKIKAAQEKYKSYLTIPRRPAWTEQTTGEELQASETEAFLKWRRKLAELEEVEQLVLTPFERNIEIWRQLWRVLERSDVVVQILDARNPLLFRNEDLESYVKELSPHKVNVLLLNKADYLTEKQRRIWCDYFNRQNIRAVFWSAVTEDNPRRDDEGNLHKLTKNLHIVDEKVEKDELHTGTDSDNNDVYEISASDSDSNTDCGDHSDDDSDIVDHHNHSDDDDIIGHDETEDNSREEPCHVTNAAAGSTTIPRNVFPAPAAESTTISRDVIPSPAVDNNHQSLKKRDVKLNKPDLLTRDELIDYLKSFERTVEKLSSDIFTVGMVGYPNVGKSSTINKLMTRKKVAVSSTPGKTKHYQTLMLLNDLMLCDCPGLVMPSFAMSRQQMLVAGILSVDQMRDYEPAVGLICSQFPIFVFERAYGITFPKEEPNEDEADLKDHRLRRTKPRELLTLYAFIRGFMSPKGLPDCSRAARVIVKDYINGRLRHCFAPPDADQSAMDDYDDWLKAAKAPPLPNAADQSETTSSSSTVVTDSQTLQTLQKRHLLYDQTKPSDVDQAFFKGQLGAVHTRSSKKSITLTSDGQRPPKKANKNQKKDKLRRVYKHLDA